MGELEYASYQSEVAQALIDLGFKPAQPNQVVRFLVEVWPNLTPVILPSYEPVYVQAPVWFPRRGDRGDRGNRLAIDGAFMPFAPRYVGDQLVLRAVQISHMSVVIRDNLATPMGGRAPTVFESRAEIQGDIPDLAITAPYLVRSIFNGFPGSSGQVHVVKIPFTADH